MNPPVAYGVWEGDGLNLRKLGDPVSTFRSIAAAYADKRKRGRDFVLFRLIEGRPSFLTSQDEWAINKLGMAMDREGVPRRGPCRVCGEEVTDNCAPCRRCQANLEEDRLNREAA